VCVINGCKIEAFPSHHLASARGLNPFIVFLDEADFFPPKEQQEARSVSERYIAKTNPHIIMVSTPYLPGGLYEQIEKEEPCLYHKIRWNYEVGLNKIFSVEQIEEAKKSITFEREYNLKYGVGVGDIFQFVDDCIERYEQTINDGQKLLTVDPAYGSSKFGIIGFEKLNGVLYVKDAVQFERPSPSAMIEVIIEKAKLFSNRVLVDSAHPGLIKDLIERGIQCTPVIFGEKIDPKNTLLSKMTINAAQMVKEKKVRIDPRYTDLIQQLKSAKFNDKGHPDKSQLSFDLGDCFLMGCYYLKEVIVRSVIVKKGFEEDD
jgi:SpoVK/Ycf46/Vps4 family AAA+-type ATPase